MEASWLLPYYLSPSKGLQQYLQDCNSAEGLWFSMATSCKCFHILQEARTETIAVQLLQIQEEQ